MKKFLFIYFICTSFLGLGQTLIPSDTLTDSKYVKFIKDLFSYAEEHEEKPVNDIVGEINSGCDMRAAHNTLLTIGYRLAWMYNCDTDKHYSASSLNSINSIVPECDSLNLDQELFTIYFTGGISYSIGTKYFVVESGLPTGNPSGVKYYYIKEEE